MPDATLIDSAWTTADRLGRLKVRWGFGRDHYRVAPGLYALGRPDPASPVLVSANYKLSFDVLRRAMAGRSAWILVLDTRGVNVWCASAKGTFATDELVRRVQEVGLDGVVSHRKLVVPQLGAPGVAAHKVKERTGFRVVFGPVRADDLPAFLDDRMLATDAMRAVTFTLRERLELVGVEATGTARYVIPAALAIGVLAWLTGLPAGDVLRGSLPLLVGIFVGLVGLPVLLPWLPGRAFSVKGASLGAPLALASLLLAPAWGPAVLAGLALIGTALSSYLSMNFTGSTPYTSPSGVEREMRRALPWQAGGLVAGLVALAVGGLS